MSERLPRTAPVRGRPADPSAPGILAVSLVVALLAGALLIPRLGASALWDPWEPKYAQTAREMDQRGDWLVPYYRHDPRLVKPPLTYWLIAASQRVLGVDEAAARLPSACLAGLAALALAGALALRGRRLEGLVAGAALVTSPQWLLLGRSATPDIPLAATGALLLAAAVAWPALRGRWRTAVGLAVPLLLAAAVLVEWPRGLLLPAWAVLGWGALVWGRRGIVALVVTAAAYVAGQHLYVGWLIVASFGLAGVLAILELRYAARLRWATILGAAALVVALAAPWYVAVFRIEPDEAADRLLGYKHALNLGEGPGEQLGPIWYPLLIVGVGALPFVGAAAAALPDALRRNGDGVARVIAGSFLGLLLFFSLAEPKMGHFYGTLQPALAGLAGVGLGALAARRDRRILLVAIAVYLAGAFVAFDGALLLEGANVFSDLDGSDPFVAASAASVAWLVVVTIGWWRGKAGWMVLGAVPAALFAGWFAIGVVPGLTASKSQGPLWQRYVAERSPHDRLGTFGWAKDSIFYYSDNGVPRLEDRSSLLEFLEGADGGARWLIVSRSDLDRMRRDGPPRAAWQLVDDRHPYHVLVRLEPPPGPPAGR